MKKTALLLTAALVMGVAGGISSNFLNIPYLYADVLNNPKINTIQFTVYESKSDIPNQEEGTIAYVKNIGLISFGGTEKMHNTAEKQNNPKNKIPTINGEALNCSDTSTASKFYKENGRCGEPKGITYWSKIIDGRSKSNSEIQTLISNTIKNARGNKTEQEYWSEKLCESGYKYILAEDEMSNTCVKTNTTVETQSNDNRYNKPDTRPFAQTTNPSAITDTDRTNSQRSYINPQCRAFPDGTVPKVTLKIQAPESLDFTGNKEFMATHNKSHIKYIIRDGKFANQEAVHVNICKEIPEGQYRDGSAINSILTDNNCYNTEERVLYAMPNGGFDPKFVLTTICNDNAANSDHPTTCYTVIPSKKEEANSLYKIEAQRIDDKNCYLYFHGYNPVEKGCATDAGNYLKAFKNGTGYLEYNLFDGRAPSSGATRATTNITCSNIKN